MKRLALVAMLLIFESGCRRAEPAFEPVELTYYYLAYCSFCQSVRAMVEQLPQQYPDRLTVRTLEHLEPEAVKAVKSLGFKSHGLVIRRGDEVVFRQPDHRVDVEQVRLALERLLGPAHPTPPLATLPDAVGEP